MKIQNFNINVSQMPTAATSRSFTISGNKGAEFMIIALEDGTLKYYDFNTKLFELGHNDLHNNLIVKLTGSTYSNNISFPSGGGNYVIKLIPINGTKILNSNSNVITKNISKQSSNATLTFKPGTADTSYYQTFTTVTSTGAINDTAVVPFDIQVLNSTTDAKSFGFSITDATIPFYNNEFWYYEKTENVVTNGSGSDGGDTRFVIVADTSEIVAGMELKFYKSTTAPENNAGSAVGLTTVTSVDTATNRINFSQNVGFDEGETMTFRAYGADLIKTSIDVIIDTGSATVLGKTLSKTVEARGGVTEVTDGSASLNIALPNTHGIGGGRNFGYNGVDVNNSSANTVNVVTPDADGSGNDGLITVTLAQELAAGTKLEFKNTFAEVNVKTTINISKYPTANKTIFFDLDKVLKLGVSGS